MLAIRRLTVLVSVVLAMVDLPARGQASGKADGARGSGENAPPQKATDTPRGTRVAAAPRMSDDESDALLLDRLDKTVADAGYDRVDFTKVVDDLRQRFDLNIHVNWSALEAAGVRRDTRVELLLKQIPLATLLDYVLIEAGGGAKEPLAYHVRGGVLIISTEEALSRQAVRRAYDVTDLLTSGYATRRFANTPILRLRRAGGEDAGGTPMGYGAAGSQPTGGGGLYGGGGGGATMAEAPAAPAEFVEIQSLIELITQTVDPESWRMAGGSVGAISSVGGRIIVVQTLTAQRQIEELLATLRRTAPTSVDGEAMIVRMPAARAAAWRQSVGAGFPRMSAEAVRALTAEAGVQTIMRGVTSGRNGERLWFSALGQRAVVGGFVPVVGDGVWRVQPVVENVHDGLELIVLPMMAPDRASLTLDIQLGLAPPADVRERVVALGPAAAGGAPDAPSTQGGMPPGSEPRQPSVRGAVSTTLDLPTRRMRTVSATVRVSNGEFIALSVPGDVSEAGPAEAGSDWLLVMVRPSAK